MPGRDIFAFLCLLVPTSPAMFAASIGADPAVSSIQFTERGDRLFRAAHFEEAEAAWLQAIDLDRANIRAHLGVARIAAMTSDRHRAARYYSTAYQLNPLDPDAVLGYANNIDDGSARRTLLENFLLLSRDARAEDVKARMLIADRLGGQAAVVQDPKRVYRIRLENTPSGPILRARVNRSRELRFLLDTGASGITLNNSAASKLDLDYLTDAALTGFGSAAPALSRIMRAKTFESGELKISNLSLEAAESDLIPGVDGVIGPDLFRDFLVRLNFPAGNLELTPFDGSASSCIDCLRAWRVDHLLLMPAAINGRSEGYFIIDSGSPCSLVSGKLVFDDGTRARFTGVQGSQDAHVLARPIAIRFAAQKLMEAAPVIFDNAEMSTRYGTEIDGAIGYSVLRNLALSIDYRTGLVKVERP